MQGRREIIPSLSLMFPLPTLQRRSKQSRHRMLCSTQKRENFQGFQRIWVFKKGWRENSALKWEVYSFIPAEDSSGISPWNSGKGGKAEGKEMEQPTWEKQGICRNVLPLSTKQGQYGELKECFSYLWGQAAEVGRVGHARRSWGWIILG